MALVLALPADAATAQVATTDAAAREATRAAQNAMRNPGDGVVTVTIGPGPAVPAVVSDAALPLVVSDTERLIVVNGATVPVWLRFVDDAGQANVDATTVLGAGSQVVLPPGDLLRLSGTDRLLAIEVTLPAAGAPAIGVIRLLVRGPAADVTQERLDVQQIITAQEALVRESLPPVPSRQAGVPPPPPAVLSVPTVKLEIGVPVAPDVVKTAARALPLDREDLILSNASGDDRIVTFIDERQRTVGTPIRVPAGGAQQVSYDDLSRWAGRDGELSFTVTWGAQSWQGHVTTDVLPLASGSVLVPIDLTGVSDWRFVNPRTPVRIGPIDPARTPAELVFSNRVPGRTVKVTFPRFTKTPQREQAFTDAGFELDCSRPNTCVPELVVQAANRTVDAVILVEAYTAADKDGLVEFKVAFFEGDIEPAYASGYLAVIKKPFEPAFSGSWGAVAVGALVRDAHFAGFTMDSSEAAIINTATPFQDQGRWHMTGNIRLSSQMKLGTRASAEVDLLVKDKDLGIADAPAVTTQKVKINVFGLNGFSMSLGRFDFAAPTRSIAIAESGEGFSGRWRRFTVSHVIRPREKADKGVIPVPAGAPALVPSSPDFRDRWSTLAQAQWAPKWVRFEVSALTGRRQTLKGGEGLFYTWGGDLIAANGFGTLKAAPAAATYVWRLNGGWYRSYRQARASDVQAPEGDRGWSALIDGSIARLKGRTPQFTVGGTLAMASADDPATPEDEGYIGESGAFAPDKIFLATLANRLAPLTLAVADAGGQSRLVRNGLVGKRYAGAGFIWNGFSPLQWLVAAVGVPPKDVGTKSVTIRWHSYGLAQPVMATANGAAGSHLGQETSMEWLLESPRGVRYTMTWARFAPGAVLKEQKTVPISTWFLDARVTVTLR
jgi:hypothetical protein